jgi:hypothetical protein
MTTYTAIADSEIDVDSPITDSLIERLRDNPIAITEGATGAPKIQTGAYQAGSINQAAIAAGYPAAQTLSDTTSATYTFAHGRAARPWRVDIWLECIVADQGYSIGDFVPAFGGVTATPGGDPAGFMVFADATNVKLIFATHGYFIIHKSSFTCLAITDGSWKAHVHAWGD